MLPSATDLLGREHVLSHEVFDPLEDGLSFRRLPEQSVVSGHWHGPGETQTARYKVEGSSWRPKFHPFFGSRSSDGWLQAVLVLTQSFRILKSSVNVNDPWQSAVGVCDKALIKPQLDS